MEARASLVAFLAACKDGGVDPVRLFDAVADVFGLDAAIQAAQQRAETAEAMVAELHRRVTFTAERWQVECRSVEAATLERAAKACETVVFYEDDPAGYARQCAAAIRSLKTQEPTHG